MNVRDLNKLFGLAVGGCAGLVSVLCAVVVASGQPLPTANSPLAPPPNGPRRTEPAAGAWALTGAVVHVKPGTQLDSATIVIRDGRVAEVIEGADKSRVPPGVQVRDLTGMHVYAGFIEPYVEVEAPRPEFGAPGSHWNPRIMPQRSALDRGAKGIDEKTAQALRSLGFTAAGISPRGGLIRGAGALVSLAKPSGDPSDAAPRVYAEKVYQSASFDAQGEGGGERQDDARWVRYPDSQMGAIALIRQTLSDADWLAGERAAARSAEPVGALDAIPPTSKVPFLFDVSDELESLRALNIAKEFARPVVLLGTGREYRRIEALKASKPRLIVPLPPVQRPRVGSIGDAEGVDLGTLIAWEQAPTNLRRLDAAGLAPALTSSKIPEKLGGRSAFKDRLAAAIKHGLPGEKALAMLTTNAAAVLGVSDQLGSVEKGKRANLVVADGPLFVDRPDAPGFGEDGFVKPGKIIDVWIDAHRHIVAPAKGYDLEGDWAVTLTPAPKKPGVLALSIDRDNQITIVKTWDDQGKNFKATSRARDVSIDDDDGRFSFVFDHDPFGEKGVFVNTGVIEKREDGSLVMQGDAVRSGGERLRWVAQRTSPPKAQEKKTLKPTPRRLAGAWVQLVKDVPAKPEDADRWHIVLDPGKNVMVKQGQREFKVTDVTFEIEDDGAEKVVTSIRFSVISLTSEGEITKFLLRPTSDRTRLSVSTRDDGAESFKLARHRLTPETDDINDIPEQLGLPVGPFAMKEPPDQGSVLIKDATVWTSGPAGILENACIAFQGGKIVYVGAALPSLQGEWTTIDAKGKHVSPGIIDCHSHTGISKGVNESGQAVTAEVRIGDVTDPDSVSWYRQLAGGVTCVSSLHGSANPIGGQNQVNKNRWGCAAPNDMHFEGAIAGIKFALGENVKQSNWGDRSTTRYPQTRMGVETLIRDRFTAAREYLDAQKKAKAAGDKSSPVRRDLELEALAEILESKRLVHCHSYRQDEILMLTRVARDFGFRIGTFQHILEGYKVADAVRDYAIGASAFSDWWAFKVEVQDAIPYAGPIMHEVGVTVSYNSDSDELARRLNVEAGKALKYAGTSMTPAEAFKFVTLNPAKQLKIDDRVGSLEVGKHADIVLWSGPPMSTLSKAERTWVDGRLLFSLEKDAELRIANTAQRQRIIQKILAQEKREKGGGSSSVESTAKPKDSTKAAPTASDAPPPNLDDDDSRVDARAGTGSARRSLLRESLQQAADLRRMMYLDMLRRGIDPRFARMGECGCDVLQTR